MDWRRANPDKAKAISDRHYKKHADKIRANARDAYHKTGGEAQRAYVAKNREKRKQTCDNWRRNNPEKILAQKRAYYRNNPAKGRAQTNKRDALKQRAMPSWVRAEEFEPIYKVAAELQAATGIKHDVDHIVPLTHGEVCGLHVPWNLQVMTASANRAKHNRFEVA